MFRSFALRGDFCKLKCTPVSFYFALRGDPCKLWVVQRLRAPVKIGRNKGQLVASDFTIKSTDVL